MNTSILAAMEKPPIIRAAVETKGSSFLFRAMCILIAVLASMSLVVYSAMPRPPKESQLIKNFYANRAAFEKLRDMLQVDEQVYILDQRGILTTNSSGFHFPPYGNLTVDRYEVYISLLKQVGGITVRRNAESRLNVPLWVWGWAGNGKNIGICWMDQAPTNQIPTLDGHFGRDPYGKQHLAYRHVDANWYLWTDI